MFFIILCILQVYNVKPTVFYTMLEDFPWFLLSLEHPCLQSLHAHLQRESPVYMSTHMLKYKKQLKLSIPRKILPSALIHPVPSWPQWFHDFSFFVLRFVRYLAYSARIVGYCLSRTILLSKVHFHFAVRLCLP